MLHVICRIILDIAITLNGVLPYGFWADSLVTLGESPWRRNTKSLVSEESHHGEHKKTCAHTQRRARGWWWGI